MSAASSGAQASDAALASQATQNTAYAKQAHDLLFGSGTTGSTGGTLSNFLNPSSLNVSGPTGAYKLQYNQAVGNIAKQSQQVQGSLARSLASRGFGNAPAGFAADQQRQAAEDATTAKGQAFTDLAGKSYSDALQNFWNATNIASGSGAASTNAAISADSAAANNYANLYGTASTPQPSVLGQVIGGGLQAGGQVGSAAMCTCKGSMILMHDGTEKMVQEIREHDEVRGIDGRPCRVNSTPAPAKQLSVEIHSAVSRSGHRCSESHTLALSNGGYVYAKDSHTELVRFRDRHDHILAVVEIGEQEVYSLDIGGSHTYCADGFWSLS